MEKIQFTITFKQGQLILAIIAGHAKEMGSLSISDVTERVIETEQYLERLTGHRVHITSETV